MANIYEFMSGFMALWNLVEDETVEDSVIEECFENMTDDFKVKMENCCKYIKNQESIIDGLKAEEQRIKAKRQALENVNARLKALMTDALNASGEKKIACGSFTCAIQNNAPSLKLDVDTRYIPEKYLIPQEPTVNKTLLKDDIKNGVEGLDGIAHLETSASLRIR